MCICTYNIVI